MPKNKGGRSISSPKIKFSPHPRIALSILRGLGATEEDIKEFRKSQRNIERIMAQMNRFSREHGINQDVGFVSYDDAIKLIRHGNVKDLKTLTNITKENYKHFMETGRSLSYDRAIQKDVDILNRALGADYFDIEKIMNADSEFADTLNALAKLLFRYEEAEQEYLNQGNTYRARDMRGHYERVKNELLETLMKAR